MSRVLFSVEFSDGSSEIFDDQEWPIVAMYPGGKIDVSWRLIVRRRDDGRLLVHMQDNRGNFGGERLAGSSDVEAAMSRVATSMGVSDAVADVAVLECLNQLRRVARS